MELHTKTINNLRAELKDHMEEYKKLFTDYHGRLEVVIDRLKLELGINWDAGTNKEASKDASKIEVSKIEVSKIEVSNEVERQKLKLEDFGSIDEEKLDGTVGVITLNLMNEKYVKLLKEFRTLYNWFVIEYMYHAKNESIVDYLRVTGSSYIRTHGISDKEKQRLAEELDYEIDF